MICSSVNLLLPIIRLLYHDGLSHQVGKLPGITSGLDSFDFTAIPSLDKMLVLELARCKFVRQYENLIALGNSGTGKTHIALALRLAARQRGFSVGFATAAGLVHQLMEAWDEKRLLRLQSQLRSSKLLIIDELGYVWPSLTGAELLFEVVSRRYERGPSVVTSNLPFEDWTSIFGSERLTGVLLDHLTHHVHILEMNCESFLLRQSKGRRRGQHRATETSSSGTPAHVSETIDPHTDAIARSDVTRKQLDAERREGPHRTSLRVTSSGITASTLLRHAGLESLRH